MNLWMASAIIFALNVFVLSWFYLSPNLSPIQVRGEDTPDRASSEAKMSPFTEVVNTHPAKRPVKHAEHLRPILYRQQPETSSLSYPDSYSGSTQEPAPTVEPARYAGTNIVPAVQVSAVVTGNR